MLYVPTPLILSQCKSMTLDESFEESQSLYKYKRTQFLERPADLLPNIWRMWDEE